MSEPTDLVALVREWQEVKREIDALNEDGGGPSPEAFAAACDRIDAAVDVLLAWEPAPPVPAGELPPIEVDDWVLDYDGYTYPVMDPSAAAEWNKPEVSARVDELRKADGRVWRRGGGQ